MPKALPYDGTKTAGPTTPCTHFRCSRQRLWHYDQLWPRSSVWTTSARNTRFMASSQRDALYRRTATGKTMGKIRAPCRLLCARFAASQRNCSRRFRFAVSDLCDLCLHRRVGLVGNVYRNWIFSWRGMDRHRHRINSGRGRDTAEVSSPRTQGLMEVTR